MQAFCFIFLRRKWEEDESYITRAITHLLGYGYPYQYLLFAEGTDLSPSNLEKDTKFAEERRVTVYRYLLHPRTRGFEHLVELLRPFPNACIYDLTVAYEGINGYLTEKRLVTGDLPSAAHVDLRRIPLSSLPSGNAAVGEWLKSHWDAKEKQLAAFYASQPRAFPDRSSGGPPLRTQLRETAMMYTITSFTVMVMWLTMITTFFYVFFSSHWFKLYAVVASGSLAYFSRTGGLDSLEQRVVQHA